MQTLTPITSDVPEFTSPEALEAFAPAADTDQAAPESEAPVTRWTIDSIDRANWFLRKRRQTEDEIATVKAQAAEMIRSLEADLNRLNARHEADFLAFAKEELARRNNGKKTLPLFQGTVAFRTVPSSLRVSGAPLAIEEAKARGWDVVKTTETLDGEAYKREAAAVLRESGEVLPGIEVVPERESVTIKFGKGKGEAETDD